MAINLGTVAAYLTLDTSKYLESLVDATKQMKSFINENENAGSLMLGFRSGLLEIETAVGKTIKDSLQSLTSQLTKTSQAYEMFVNSFGNNRQIVGASDNLVRLAKEAENAAIAVGKMNEAYDGDVQAAYVTSLANRKAVIAAELKEFSQSYSQRADYINNEMSLQTNGLKSYFEYAKVSYRDDNTGFKALEVQKTVTQKTELTARRIQLMDTMAQIYNVMTSYIGAFERVGKEYGNVLLSGIKSTGSQIASYLESVSSSVRSAQSGGGVYLSAYAEGTDKAAKGLAIVGEYGKPEIVDFSGGENVLSFNRSIAMMGAASEAAYSYSNAVSDMLSTKQAATGIDYEMLANAVASAVLENAGKNIIYSPTYNSPQPASISELKRQDEINMRRLALSF